MAEPFRTEQYWVSFQGPHWYLLPHHITVKNCSYKYNHNKHNYLDTNSILYLWWGTITLSLVPFTYFRCSCHFPGFQGIAHWVRDFIRDTKWWQELKSNPKGYRSQVILQTPSNKEDRLLVGWLVVAKQQDWGTCYCRHQHAYCTSSWRQKVWSIRGMTRDRRKSKCERKFVPVTTPSTTNPKSTTLG